MKHLLIAPVVLPAFVGALQLLLGRRGIALQRLLAIAATLLLVTLALRLLALAHSGAISVYAIGDWAAPLGIVLVLDRLSAYMLLLAALVALWQHRVRRARLGSGRPELPRPVHVPTRGHQRRLPHGAICSICSCPSRSC